MRYLIEENELYHYARGEQVKNHKYVKRERKNGKWVYYYTDAHTNGLKFSPDKKTYSYQENNPHAVNYQKWAQQAKLLNRAVDEYANQYSSKKQQQKARTNIRKYAGNSYDAYKLVSDTINTYKPTASKVRDVWDITTDASDFLNRIREHVTKMKKIRDKTAKVKLKNRAKNKKHSKTTARVQTK